MQYNVYFSCSSKNRNASSSDVATVVYLCLTRAHKLITVTVRVLKEKLICVTKKNDIFSYSDTTILLLKQKLSQIGRYFVG